MIFHLFTCISWYLDTIQYRLYAYDVTNAMLVSLNNDKSTILVCHINPGGEGGGGVELFCNAKTFFSFIKQTWPLVTWAIRSMRLLAVCFLSNSAGVMRRDAWSRDDHTLVKVTLREKTVCHQSNSISVRVMTKVAQFRVQKRRKITIVNRRVYNLKFGPI